MGGGEFSRTFGETRRDSVPPRIPPLDTRLTLFWLGYAQRCSVDPPETLTHAQRLAVVTAERIVRCRLRVHSVFILFMRVCAPFQPGCRSEVFSVDVQPLTCGQASNGVRTEPEQIESEPSRESHRARHNGALGGNG